MASRQETIDFIKSNFKYEELNGGVYKLIFELEGGRSQLAFFEVTDLTLTITSPCASTDDVSATQLFEAIDETGTPFGLRRFGSYYGLAHIVLLENVDPNEISDGAAVVSIFADKVESALGLGDKF